MQNYENKAVDENVPAEQVGSNKRGSKQKNGKTPALDPAPNQKQAFMYLGPNIPGGRLFSGSVFCGGSIADIVHLQDVLEKLPEVKSLFAEIAKVPKFKAEVVTQGTEAHRLYTVAVSKLKKEVLKDGV